MSTAALRCGFVAVIGAPNAGKSTLVNTLVGSKISIVTPKVQTTRMRVRGVATEGAAQMIFVDTPGIFRPRRLLDRAMVRAAWAGAGEADAVLLLVDAPAAARGPALRDALSITDDLRRSRPKNTALVLNKIDQIAHERLLPLAGQLKDGEIFEAIFMISALSGDGVAELRRWCAERLPEGPWLYPADQLADIPSRLLASEITREKLYMSLHNELPYATTVETESWTEKQDGSVRIEQTIFVERESQKAIVLGKGGSAVKRIGTAARRELEAMFGRRVHLLLFVKVRAHWAEERERLCALGLDAAGE